MVKIMTRSEKLARQREYTRRWRAKEGVKARERDKLAVYRMRPEVKDREKSYREAYRAEHVTTDEERARNREATRRWRAKKKAEAAAA